MKSSDPTIDKLAVSHQTTIQYLNQIYQKMQSNQECFNNIEIVFQSIQDFKYYMEDIDSKLLPISIREEEITVTNSVDLLHEYPVISIFDNKNGFYQKVINFISCNFDDVENKEKLSVDELELILSNESFQIQSESSLFQFLVNFIDEKGENAKVLFGYIEYQNLPVSDIQLFLQKVTLDDLNGPIWAKLQNRLLLNFPISFINNPRYKNSEGFTVDTNKEFSGIISSLNEECGGNCSEKGVIEVKCSKIQGRQKATDLTDYKNTGDHYSWIDNQLNGYFEFDFKEKKVILTDYELKTPNNGDDNGYPKNWSVECSDDGVDWLVVDNVTNDENLHGPNKHHFFKVKNEVSKPCRFIRIYQRGYSHMNSQNYYFGLYFVEFYGKIIE